LESENQLFILLTTVLALAFFAALGLVCFLIYRKMVRKTKDIERSLKLVPLQIKLPPAEASEAGGRDTRELFKENISKAEGIFNLLSGITADKSKLYGNRYVSFEIIADGQMIYFYTAVPVTLLSTVQKALISGYPTIQIEQVDDPNIFSKTSKLAGIAGGELELANDSYYPIATYKNRDADPLAGILSSLSRLQQGEGAGIQILVRPAHKKWAKNAKKYAKDLLDPEKIAAEKHTPQKMLKEIAMAPIKQPKYSKKLEEGTIKQDYQPDAINQKMSQLVEEKYAMPAFETMIRVIASSDDPNKSKATVQDILTGFAQMALPNSNQFKLVPAKSSEQLATDFIFRFFPANKNKTVLNSTELAGLFHFPGEDMQVSTPVIRKGAREVAAPADLADEGLILGSNLYRGQETVVRLTDDDRRRHVYIIGQTGTGKSVFLENCIVQDMHMGRGLCFLDPHGDTAEALMAKVPPHRLKDVIYFNPGDTEYPLGFNLLEFDPAHPEQKDFLVLEAINMFYKLYDPKGQGFVGPMFVDWFRNAALTVMSDPEGGTLIEVPKLFTNDEYLKQKFRHVKDPIVQEFWTGQMAQTSEHSKSEMLGYFTSKFGDFANNEIMRNIIGQKHSSFNLRDVMDNKKILFVNLSKGLLGDMNSKILGIVFIIKFQMAAMSRADMDEKDRQDFSVYIDEFQNYATDSIATILSEARKYRLSMIMANQFISQLEEPIRDAVFGNVGNMVGFRVGPEDAEFMAKQFAPQFDKDDIINTPNLNAVARIINKGAVTPAFSLKEIFPPIGVKTPGIYDQMVQISRQNYARPKAEVAAEIAKALAVVPATPKPEPGKMPISTGRQG
jgi:hypothetical protein